MCRLFNKIQNLGQIPGHICVSGVGNGLKLLSGKLSYPAIVHETSVFIFHKLRKASSGLRILNAVLNQTIWLANEYC